MEIYVSWDDIENAEDAHEENCQCVYETSEISEWCAEYQRIYYSMESLGF